MRGITLIALGVVFLVLSIAGRHWVMRRKFYRRNAAGMEGFTDYKDSVIKQSMENFVFGASRISLFLGIVLLLFAYIMWGQ
jgi:hypothetical protein